MSYIRQDVRGTSGQDIAKINDNFMNIFEKVFGDINFSDADKSLQNNILTQWIPFQGEGNLDKNYPLHIRFYVPPNVKTIKSAKLNAFVENYRMDSDVTSGGGGVAGGSVTLSISGGGNCVGSGYTASKTAYVTKWGTPPYEYEAPTKYLIDGNMNGNMTSLMGGFLQSTDKVGLASVILSGMRLNMATPYADLKNFQHSHELPPISVSVNVPAHSHTGEANISIPDHHHKLAEGIRVSTTAPQTTNIYVNNNKVCSVSSSNASANNIDISPYINIGDWNIIKVDTVNLARISVYGTIEAIMKYTSK